MSDDVVRTALAQCKAWLVLAGPSGIGPDLVQVGSLGKRSGGMVVFSKSSPLYIFFARVLSFLSRRVPHATSAIFYIMLGLELKVLMSCCRI